MAKLATLFNKEFNTDIKFVYCNCHRLNVSASDALEFESYLFKFLKVFTSTDCRKLYAQFLYSRKDTSTKKMPTLLNTRWCFMDNILAYIKDNNRIVHEFMKRNKEFFEGQGLVDNGHYIQ